MATEGRSMSETRKIAAILVADVVGYSRLAGADEERTLARLAVAAGRCAATLSIRQSPCITAGW
jgi:class 3 adenylate cyclase